MLLKKFLIPNNKNITDTTVRNQYGIVAAIFGIISNILLSIGKLIIGFITHSISIIADAINNMSDVIASIITLAGFKLSSKKANETHPYGYARSEYVANLFVSIFVFLVGILFIKESILKILHPELLLINISTFVVLILSILVKGLQVYIYIKFANEIDSDTLRSTARDSINDIMTSGAILISMIVMSIFHINIDSIMALAISVYIILNAIKMLDHSLDPLIGIKPTKKQVNEITKKLLSYPDVIGIHDLVIHNYGVNNDFVTVHIEMDEDLSLMRSHQVADRIEEDFYNDNNINITVHVDPINSKDDEVLELKAQVSSLLQNYNPKITIHDFRIFRSKKNIKVIFDCVTPFNQDIISKDITDYLKKKLNQERNKYIFIIKMDKDYC